MNSDKEIKLLNSINKILDELDNYKKILINNNINNTFNNFSGIVATIFKLQEEYVNNSFFSVNIKNVLYGNIVFILNEINASYEKLDKDFILNKVEHSLIKEFLLLKELLELNLIVNGQGKKLHIGGREKKDGWEIYDAVNSDIVDYVGNAKELSRFSDESFDILYASHVVEHFDYKSELVTVLKEWKRVLKSGGKIYISVPDLDVLANLFIMKDKFDIDERYFIMRMMFGGHINEYDYHYTGLNFEFLASFLYEAGFKKVYKVDNLELFNDSSKTELAGIPISLNIVASK